MSKSKTVVITGGTDGIGRAVADLLMRRGDRVAIVGTDTGKGAGFVKNGEEAPGQAKFIRADLSRIADNATVIEQLLHEFSVIDAVMLCARYFRARRTVTADGLEANFALNYLSRYLLSYGLEPALERSPTPVLINVSGPGGDPSIIRWDDLQFGTGYNGVTAMFMAGVLNDLLGAAFAGRSPPARTRYVLYGPGPTATSFAGEYDPATLAHVEGLKRNAKPASEAALPIVQLMVKPPQSPLSAFTPEGEVDAGVSSFDSMLAGRLDQITRPLAARSEQSGPTTPTGTYL